ncbi:MAG TPA: hypothetical protein VN972_05960, partial [Methylomirabilota bacterium]|nr:hypothetical protein [Methylomirabilota bacterium]
IVEDVAVLCPRFAIIREGRLLALTSPSEARASIAGHIYEGTVAVEDLPKLRAERMVTQALLVEGKNRARIYDPSGAPPDGFVAAPVTLEDAYLVSMRLGALPARGKRVPLGGVEERMGPAASVATPPFVTASSDRPR